MCLTLVAMHFHLIALYVGAKGSSKFVGTPAFFFASSTLADDKAILEHEMIPFKIPVYWMVGQFISEVAWSQQLLLFKVSRWQTPYAAPLYSRCPFGAVGR